MNTLKRKLTAALLTLAMLLSLMPAFPQAAEAALDKTTVNNDAIQVEYTANGAFNSTVEVMVQDEEGNLLAKEPLILKNIVSGAPHNVTITALDNSYFVANVETTSGSVTIPSYDYDNSNMSFNWARMDDGSRVIVTLSKKIDPDSVNIDNWVEGGLTRNYYIYQDQLLKMIALNDSELQANIKNLDIRGIKIKPNWVQPFQVAEGTGSDKEFRQVDTLASQDRAYWDLLRVTTDNGDVGKVQPDRIKSLTITYNYGGEDKVITVPSSDLHYYANSVDQSYTIECEAPDKSIVVFYDRPNGAAARDYSLYDIRLVDTGDAIGTLPPDPVYAQGTYYKFVNWEYDNWSGEGLPFLSTTIVNDDINVFSHKVSTSELGGTQIRVLNDDDQLLNRIVELYNADTTHEPISKENIDLGTVSIRAYDADTQTDEDYLDNGWESDYEYFQIRNYAAVGNEHVSFDGLQGIYVYFELVGQDTKNTVQLTVGEQVGDLAKLMIGPENETILQLRVNQPGEVIDDGEEEPDPQPPTTPTYEELKALIGVTVDCSSVGHDSKTRELLANTGDQNDSYTLDFNGTTATVKVHNAPYVTWYAGEYDGIQHRIVEGTALDQTVALEYDATNGWQLAAGQANTVAFSVVCSGGSVTPDPGVDITGFEKDLITEDEYAAIDNTITIWQEDFDVKDVKLPVKGETVVIPYESNVTLLYSITVSGAGDKQFKVIDNGATLVGSTDASVEQSGDTFTGTLPKNGGSVTFYVTKTFNDVEEIDNKTYVANRASIEGNVADDVDKDVTEAVEAEKATQPEDPTYEDMKEPVVNGAVKIDCINPLVQHEGPTYGLIEGSYTLPENGVVGNEANGFTYTITVSPDKYVETYNTNTHSSHTLVDGQSAKTITYKYDNGDWVVADTTALPLVYEVNCDATPDQYINGFDKELVSTAEAAEAAVGTSEGYAFPNKQEIVLVPNGGEVTLLYSITVEGKPGTAFVIEDKGAELVKGDVDDTRGDNLFYGHLPTGEKSLTFYVAKTFKAADITDGKLTNHATIKIDKEDGEEGAIDPDVNPDVDEEVDAEEEDNRPTPPPYIPGGDDDDNLGDNDKPSGLNTEDHFSYVVGYEDGMVKPQRSITRAEVATIFYRLLEDDVRDDYDTTRNNFSDVTSDSWYNQTVSTLASMGILKGYEDGTFRPNASITRAEFAAIATRFFEETGATYEPGTFTDVTGDEWFAGAIMDAVNLGLIGGYEDGTVRPNNNITRAEACAIVNRTLGRVPDADHLLPADEMTTWPDNPSSAWFYADMQEATNGHEYSWITEDGNKIEEWTDILDKDWNDR